MIDVVIHTGMMKKMKLGRKTYLGFQYSSKTEIEKLEFDVGGSGHNVAVGLSKLGNDIKYAGRIGKDPNGILVKHNFEKEGVDISSLHESNKSMTGFSQVFITPDGEKSILTYRGANDMLKPSDIRMNDLKCVDWFIFTTVLSHSSLETVSDVIDIVKKKDGKVVSNPSITMIKQRKEELVDFVKKSDIVIMNKEEAFELTNIRYEDDALEKLMKMGPEYVIITLGSNGLIASDGKRVYEEPPFNVEILDTTGAGDGFTAGFLHWFAKTGFFEDALIFGNATAALNMESVGATKNLPSEDDIIELMKW